MFPLRWNFPFRKKDGGLSTIQDAIDGAGGSYSLPTASANTKGGIKVGDGLTMDGEKLNADSQIPAYSSAEAGKALKVNENGSLEWGTAGGSSLDIKTGSQNFTLGESGWNSFSVSFGSDFADTNYIWLYTILNTGSQTETSKIPINVFMKTKNVGSISGRIYNANDQVITGTVQWIAIHL